MRRLSIACLAALFGLSCAEEATTGIGQSAKETLDPGALLALSASSSVGVVLDELPTRIRSRVAADLLGKPARFWKERAAQQLKLMRYRLIFREFFYSRPKKQLPLPPEPQWDIRLVGSPVRANHGGHDVVKINFTFQGTLLSDAKSPGVSEPNLKDPGGVWKEPFILPIDPELLLQRTDYACMDEEDFPFPSVDSEETDSFYDQECDVERGLSAVGQCHQTKAATKSCAQAVADHVGRVDVDLQFKRLPWNAALAAQVRYGRVTNPNGADLEVYLPDFMQQRVVYRYMNQGGCEQAENCVGGLGWRRLLQFGTSDENTGTKTLTIGGVDYTVTGHSGELDDHNLFEYSACHNHYHFKYYGAFSWQGSQVINQKRGFCLQSTDRVSNREDSPLNNPFGGCGYQGVEVGWVDQYKAGLPCQWLDLTDVAAGNGSLGFTSNPDGLLCEGQFVNSNGDPLGKNDPVVWADTGLVSETGESVQAPLCSLYSDWQANNAHQLPVTLKPHGEGLITTTCERGQIGPLRNCGFKKQTNKVTCSPGQTVRLSCTVPKSSTPQVLRVCEYSNALQTGIPCKYEDSWVPKARGVSDQPYTLANSLVDGATTVTFTCPAPRTTGAPEPGGAYSLYTGAAYPSDASATVTCTQL